LFISRVLKNSISSRSRESGSPELLKSTGFLLSQE
jgi:hypothetical protein